VTQTAFDRALLWVLDGGHGWGGERGRSDNPHDGAAKHVPEGAVHTVDGITQPVYDEFRLGAGELPRPVAQIEPAEVASVYYRIWRRAWCDQVAMIPAESVALVIFDGVVQHGRPAAVEMWQRVVRSVPDGVPGPDTLTRTRERLAALGERIVAAAYLDRRYRLYLAILDRHPDYYRFRRGWRRRLNAVAAQVGLPPAWPEVAA